MKKAYFLCLLTACLPLATFAQTAGVGIGTTTPNASAVLDVQATAKGVSFPNIQLASQTDVATIAAPIPGLMVYNTNTALPCGAGLYFNNGTTTAPSWTCFTKTIQNFHAYDTNGRTLATPSNVLVLQPGCSITVVVPAGQTVDIKVDAVIGAYNTGSGSGNIYAYIMSAIELDGARLPKGGYNQFLLNGTGTGTAIATTSLSTWLSGVTAGSHTIELYTNYFFGTVPIVIGGNASNANTANAGEIHATVYYR